MNITKPCCPSCRSTELRLVGCFLLGPEGIPITESVTPELLLTSDFAITRALVRCEVCTQRATLEEARNAASLPTTNVLWEDTDFNIKAPIVCPMCKNTEFFVREVVRAYQETEYVSIQESKAVVTGEGGDPSVLQEVSQRYLCSEDGCVGVITLRSGTYTLVKDV
jgi:hypothetical protein